MPRFGVGLGLGLIARRARRLLATPGVLRASTAFITISAQDAGLRVARLLAAAQGSFTISGQDANLLGPSSRVLVADQASLTITGETMTPLINYLLPAAQASMTINGQAANLVATRTLAAAMGSLTISGQAATLTKSGGAATTWDPAQLPTLFTLRTGNLICDLDFGGASGFIRSTARYSSGLKHFKATFTSSGVAGIGLTNGTETNTSFLGTTGNSVGYLNNGIVQCNSSTITTLATFASGDPIEMEYKQSTNEAWFRINGTGNWNNSGTANPVTGVGGVTLTGFSIGSGFYAAAFNQNGGNTITGDFLSTPPSGFSNF